jgi:hypothetical protein
MLASAPHEPQRRRFVHPKLRKAGAIRGTPVVGTPLNGLLHPSLRDSKNPLESSHRL